MDDVNSDSGDRLSGSAASENECVEVAVKRDQTGEGGKHRQRPAPDRLHNAGE